MSPRLFDCLTRKLFIGVNEAFMRTGGIASFNEVGRGGRVEGKRLEWSCEEYGTSFFVNLVRRVDSIVALN